MVKMIMLPLMDISVEFSSQVTDVVSAWLEETVSFKARVNSMASLNFKAKFVLGDTPVALAAGTLPE
jgi:hypothetical protein